MTETSDVIINGSTQKAAQQVIAAAYRARRAKCEAALTQTFGKHEAEKYLASISEENPYDAFEVLGNGTFFSTLTIPDLTVLTALGAANLKGLLNEQRLRFKLVKRERCKLKVVEVGLLQDTYAKEPAEKIDETLYCNGYVSLWSDLFGGACEFCPQRLKYFDALDEANLALFRSDATPIGSDFDACSYTTTKAIGARIMEDRAERINPAGKPCFVFTEKPGNEVLRKQFIENLRAADTRMEKHSGSIVQYVKRLLEAKHDGRLQADLPPFPCYRPENYLQEGELYCLYLYGKEKMGVPDGFQWYKVDSAGQGLPNFVAEDDTGKMTALTVDELQQRFGRLGFDAESLQQVELMDVDTKSAMVLKPWEIVRLRQNPEYAKMWVHSNMFAQDFGRAEIAKFLQILLEK